MHKLNFFKLFNLKELTDILNDFVKQFLNVNKTFKDKKEAAISSKY